MLFEWENVKRKGPEPEVETFVVIKGKQRIYSKILQMTKETNTDFSALLPVPDLIRIDGLGLSESLPKSTIQARFLTELLDKKLSAIKALGKRIEKSGFSVRAKNPEIGLQLSPSMVMRDSKEILFFITPRINSSLTQEDVCLWTNCRELVNSFVVVFEDLWRNSVDIENIILEMERGAQSPRTVIINDAQIAKRKYDEAMQSAREEIMLVTSSEGLIKLSEDRNGLKELTKKGVSIKVLAPITGKNIEAAMDLLENCEVRHGPMGWLATAIIDKQHLFQFKIPSAKEPTNSGYFNNVLYTSDSLFVETTKKMLYKLWENARIPSKPTLESVIEKTYSDANLYEGKLLGKVIGEKPLGAITEKDLLEKIFTGKKYPAQRGLKDIVRYYGSSAMGIVYPPIHFGLPEIFFNVIQCNKKSSFGAEDWIILSLKLETTEGAKYVPVVHVTDNPKAARARRALFSDTPSSASVQVMKEHELQVHVHGSSLFAGWTTPIPLPILNSSIPPAGLLFEGYGDVRSGSVTRLTQRGRRQEVEYNRLEALLTFFHPASKYSGPGIDGFFDREMIFTSYPPLSK